GPLTTRPPVLPNPNLQASAVGVPIAPQPHAQAPHGDATTSFLVAGLPHNLSLGAPSIARGTAAVVISGTPDTVDPIGTTVTVTATDAYGAKGTITYQWPIVNRPPVVTTTPPTQFTQPNVPAAFQARAADPGR